MTEQRFILGCGPGRCGTKSLAAMLDQQPDCVATHEARPLLKWDDIITPRAALARLDAMAQRCDTPVVADVCLAYGPHLEAFLKCGHDVRTIIMDRHDDEIVESFQRKCGRVNHWSSDGFMAPGEKRYREWHDQFPKFDMPTTLALRSYLAEYRSRTDWIVRRWPDRAMVFHVGELGDRQRVRELLCWCGFKSPVLRMHHLNKGG